MFIFFIRFNKRAEDFSSLRAYNDYLEMVEDISKWLKEYVIPLDWF